MALITNLTPTTELEAVNAMLAAIGEAPISALEGATQADVQIALALLRMTTREVQSWGWRWNLDFGYEILPFDTYESTDSNGDVITLNVFVPPPRLASFEVSQCPGQQGLQYPDIVLRTPVCYTPLP